MLTILSVQGFLCSYIRPKTLKMTLKKILDENGLSIVKSDADEFTKLFESVKENILIEFDTLSKNMSKINAINLAATIRTRHTLLALSKQLKELYQILGKHTKNIGYNQRNPENKEEKPIQIFKKDDNSFDNDNDNFLDSNFLDFLIK